MRFETALGACYDRSEQLQERRCVALTALGADNRRSQRLSQGGYAFTAFPLLCAPGGYRASVFFPDVRPGSAYVSSNLLLGDGGIFSHSVCNTALLSLRMHLSTLALADIFRVTCQRGLLIGL